MCKNLVQIAALVILTMLSACTTQQFQTDFLPAKPTGFSYFGEFNGRYAGEQLLAPQAVVLDQSGNLYIADTGNDRIVKLDPEGRYLASSGGFGVGSGFSRPVDIASSDGINFFVLDQGNRRIVKLDYNLIVADEIEFADQDELLSVGDAAGLGVGNDGRIYLLDPDNLRVIVLNTDYEVERELTTGGGFVGCAHIAFGPLNRAHIYDDREQAVYIFDAFGNQLNRITLDEVGELGGLAVTENFYILSDRRRHELAIYSTAGTAMLRVGRLGDGAYHFNTPAGLALRYDGRLYLADSGNNRIVYYEMVAE
ncbi:MAG: NHL repeat-containing protein [bacterium]